MYLKFQSEITKIDVLLVFFVNSKQCKAIVKVMMQELKINVQMNTMKAYLQTTNSIKCLIVENYRKNSCISHTRR